MSRDSFILSSGPRFLTPVVAGDTCGRIVQGSAVSSVELIIAPWPLEHNKVIATQCAQSQDRRAHHFGHLLRRRQTCR